MCSFRWAWSVPNGDFHEARAARGTFMGLLGELATHDSDLEAAELIFGELVTNALRFSADGVHVELRHEADEFWLDVRDRGGCFDLDALQPPTIRQEGGRGLMIVKALSETVRVTRTDDGCEVSTQFRLRCREWMPTS